MSKQEHLFKFATKVGSLEGYLYEREPMEELTNWVGNIDAMYKGLPDAVKAEIKAEYAEVLKRILTYGARWLKEDVKLKLSRMLAEL